MTEPILNLLFCSCVGFLVGTLGGFAWEWIKGRRQA